MVVSRYFDRKGSLTSHKRQHNKFTETHSLTFEVFLDVALDRAPRKTLIPTKCSSLSGSSVFMFFFFSNQCLAHFCCRTEWSRIVSRFLRTTAEIRTHHKRADIGVKALQNGVGGGIAVRPVPGVY